MTKVNLIALRELNERIRSRSFLTMAVLGPVLVLGLIYILFAIGGQSKKHWNVLISDPFNIMDTKIMAGKDASVTYDFANSYIKTEDFAKQVVFQKYDALLEINEKVLQNKTAFLFFREKPTMNMGSRIHYQFERRLEEVMLQHFSDMPLSKFRELKQPVNLAFRNVYDPLDESSDKSAWVGYFFGLVVVVFVFLFGMTILRSVTREKSNRIVEVILASVKPRQLMLGKIAGIGVAALIQFVIWVLVIGAGLFLMRETLFPNLMDAANLNITQMTNEIQNQSMQENAFRAREYNEFVELIFERIQFGSMLFFFALFFISAYLFYGTFFAALGAASGSENDGQQFVIPLIFMLVFAAYSGYYVLENPTGPLVAWFTTLPFTSPVACMVRLAQGYPEGSGYLIYLSLVILLLSSFIVLWMAGRLYQNGILNSGHRLRLRHLIIWIRRS